MRLERGLVAHCAPTLACLKTGSLFNFFHNTAESPDQQVEEWNRQLAPKGVQVLLLRRGQRGSLIYVYRPKKLEEDLSRPCVVRFLRRYGYEGTGVEQALRRLCQRLGEADEFPHEIGLFLGYPLEDVAGFIANGGKNCKCTGCWKVYCNEEEAVRRFTQFKKCAQVYQRLWEQGRSVEQLTVAVS